MKDLCGFYGFDGELETLGGYGVLGTVMGAGPKAGNTVYGPAKKTKPNPAIGKSRKVVKAASVIAAKAAHTANAAIKRGQAYKPSQPGVKRPPAARRTSVKGVDGVDSYALREFLGAPAPNFASYTQSIHATLTAYAQESTNLMYAARSAGMPTKVQSISRQAATLCEETDRLARHAFEVTRHAVQTGQVDQASADQFTAWVARVVAIVKSNAAVCKAIADKIARGVRKAILGVEGLDSYALRELLGVEGLDSYALRELLGLDLISASEFPAGLIGVEGLDSYALRELLGVEGLDSYALRELLGVEGLDSYALRELLGAFVGAPVDKSKMTPKQKALVEKHEKAIAASTAAAKNAVTKGQKAKVAVVKLADAIKKQKDAVAKVRAKGRATKVRGIGWDDVEACAAKLECDPETLAGCIDLTGVIGLLPEERAAVVGAVVESAARAREACREQELGASPAVVHPSGGCRCPACKKPLCLVLADQVAVPGVRPDIVANAPAGLLPAPGVAAAGARTGRVLLGEVGAQPGSPAYKSTAPGCCFCSCPSCGTPIRLSVGPGGYDARKVRGVAKRLVGRDGYRALAHAIHGDVRADHIEIFGAENITVFGEAIEVFGYGEASQIDPSAGIPWNQETNPETGAPYTDAEVQAILASVGDLGNTGGNDVGPDDATTPGYPLHATNAAENDKASIPDMNAVGGIPYDFSLGTPPGWLGSYSYFYKTLDTPNGDRFGIIYGGDKSSPEWPGEDSDKWILVHGQYRHRDWWENLNASSIQEARAQSLAKGYGNIIGNPAADFHNGDFAGLKVDAAGNVFWLPGDAPKWATAAIDAAAEFTRKQAEEAARLQAEADQAAADLAAKQRAEAQAEQDAQNALAESAEQSRAAIEASQQAGQQAQMDMDAQRAAQDQATAYAQADAAQLQYQLQLQQAQLQFAQQQAELDLQRQRAQLDYQAAHPELGPPGQTAPASADSTYADPGAYADPGSDPNAAYAQQDGDYSVAPPGAYDATDPFADVPYDVE